MTFFEKRINHNILLSETSDKSHLNVIPRIACRSQRSTVGEREKRAYPPAISRGISFSLSMGRTRFFATFILSETNVLRITKNNLFFRCFSFLLTALGVPEGRWRTPAVLRKTPLHHPCEGKPLLYNSLQIPSYQPDRNIPKICPYSK